MFSLPKFTIRQLLLAMIAVAIVLASLGNAVNGGIIGGLVMISLGMAVVTLALLAMAYWFWYLIAAVIAVLFKHRREPKIRGLPLWLTGFVGFSIAGTHLSVNAQTTVLPATIDYRVTLDHGFPSPRNEGSYFPVRIKLEAGSLQPVSSDQHFTVFYDKGYFRYVPVTVRAPMVIEAGRTETTVEIYIPGIDSRYSNNNYTLQICAGKNLSQPVRSSRIFFHQDWSGNQQTAAVPATLLISSRISPLFSGNTFDVYRGQVFGNPQSTNLSVMGELPNLNNMIDLYQDFQTNRALVSGIYYSNPKVHACHPDRLPQSWLGWTALERVFISLTDFQAMMENNSSARAILKDWVAAGGMLIIFDVPDFSAEANRCWDQLTRQSRNDQRANQIQKTLWKELTNTPLPPDKMQGALLVESDPYDPSYQSAYDIQLSNAKSRDSLIEKVRQNPDRWWKEHSLPGDEKIEAEFLLRRYLLGGIAMVASDFSDWDKDRWLKFECAIDLMPTHLSSVIRNANTNDWVDGFAIEGVGEPPLRLFQILLSVFLFLAGPVVYFTLLRTGNMQWLFVLVPAISLTASLGLIANALLVDGLGTHARVRSVTWLDQASQTAVTQARLSCYSNLTPPGYSFFTDTAALLSSNRYGESQGKVRLKQENNRYIFSGGGFIARQPFQLVSLRSHPMSESVGWLPAEFDPSDPALKKEQTSPGKLLNRLGTKATFILARTEDGLVHAQNLANEATGEAIPIEADLANELLAKLATEISPETAGIRRYGFQNNTRRFIYSYQTPAYTKGSISNTGEQQAIANLKGLRGVDLLKEPNSYIAILEEFTLLDNQVSPLPFKNRIHVVIGKW